VATRFRYSYVCDIATASGPSRPGHRLRAGRHGLPRSFVAQNQRERILAAVADATSASGYAAMTVAEVIASAGVSRRTFYEHFPNKEQAFLSSYDEAVGRLLAAVRWAYGSRDSFAGRVRAGLEMLVLGLSADPAFARMCVVEVMSAGAEARRRRDATVREFASMLDENARALLPEPRPRLLAEAAIGGIYDVLQRRIERDELEHVPALLPGLVYCLLLPYVGHAEAVAERDRLASEGPALDVSGLGRVARPRADVPAR
jgi:AcrR family transcriptional regulator